MQQWSWKRFRLVTAGLGMMALLGCPLPDATSRAFECTPEDPSSCAQGWACVDGTCRAGCGVGCPGGTMCDVATQLCLPNTTGQSSSQAGGSSQGGSSVGPSTSTPASGGTSSSGGGPSSASGSSRAASSSANSNSRSSSAPLSSSSLGVSSSSVVILSSSSLGASSATSIPVSSSVGLSSSSGPGPATTLALVAPLGVWRAGDCFGPFQVQARDQAGVVTTLQATVRFTIGSDTQQATRLTVSASNVCDVPVSDPRINNGESTALFYVRTLTATPALTITVTPDLPFGVMMSTNPVFARPPSVVAVVPSAVTADVGACTQVSLSVTDEYGNQTGPAATAQVTFSGQAGVASVHLTGACGSAVTNVTLSAAQPPLHIYVKTEQPGSTTLSAASTGLQSAQVAVTTAAAHVEITGPVALETTRCAGPFTASVRNDQGNAVFYAGALNVPNPTGGSIFQDPCCRAPQTSFILPAGTPGTFYVAMTQAGPSTLTATTAQAAITAGSLPVTTTAAAVPWATAEYCRRQPLVVTAQDAVVAGYAVPLVVDHALLVTNLQVRPDGNDLRIFTSAGVELNRVLDDASAYQTANTTLWVRLPGALGSGQAVTLYLYHDNAYAPAPPANPSQVFTRVDDFEDGNLAGWDNLGGAFAVGACPGGGQCAVVTGSTSVPVANAWLLAQGLTVRGHLVEGRWRPTADGYALNNVLQASNQAPVNGYVGGFQSGFGVVHMGEFTAGTGYVPTHAGTQGLAVNVWNHVGFAVTEQDEGRLFLDGVQMLPTVGFTGPMVALRAPGQPGFLVAGIDNGVTLYLDDVRIRPYVLLEPVSQAGTGEKR